MQIAVISLRHLRKVRKNTEAVQKRENGRENVSIARTLFTKLYIFFSAPGPVDVDKYQALAPVKCTLSAYGGISANLFWSITGGVLIAAVKPENINRQIWLIDI